MKIRLISACLACGILQSTVLLAEEPSLPSTENDKISYSVGYQLGENFKQQGQSFNTEFLFKGIEDSLNKTTPMLTPDERKAALTTLTQRLGEAEREKRQRQAEKNLTESKAFLAENANQEGVITLPSGLQYKEITAGSGASPKLEDKVTVHYTGRLINGTVFDSSHQRNQPATFQVNRVIKGWTEALQLMQEGDKWELYIPPELAYGDKQAGGRIPANSALIFEVELISVN
jgi:FKBP-type peptidyl-prolyl cis-trans isomerase FklB